MAIDRSKLSKSQFGSGSTGLFGPNVQLPLFDEPSENEDEPSAEEDDSDFKPKMKKVKLK